MEHFADNCLFLNRKSHNNWDKKIATNYVVSTELHMFKSLWSETV